MRRHLLAALLVLSACAPSPSRAPTSGASSAALTETGPEAFELWLSRYLSTDQVGRGELELEGVQLASVRRERVRALLLSDPEQAIRQALTPVEREALPLSVSQHVEQWRDGVGTLHVIAGVGAEDSPPGLDRFVTFEGDDEVLRAGVYGARSEGATRAQVRLHGVALDGAIALTDSRLRRLFPGETRPTLPVEWPRACPVSKKRAETELVFHGGDTLYGFCVPEHAEQHDGTLALGEEQTAADLGLPPASAWTEGAKTVLYVRVDFSDRTGDPVSASSAQAMIDTNTNQFYQSNSYGKTGVSATVTPTLRLPKTQAEYKVGDQYILLRSDALQVARDAGYDLTAYNLDVVAFASTFSGWAGRGYVGSKGTWLNGNFGLGVTAHELGHNYGVYHANFWNAAGLTVIGPGTNTEYGNPFDIMGTAGGQANHFNAWFKRRFDWVTSPEVSTITTSGTYRVYELEKPIAAGLLHGLRVPRVAPKDYWVEYRPAINTAATRDGVSINWGYASNTAAHLLDMTPGDGSRTNSTLIIGRTFSDVLANLHFTPVAKGGTTPESIDMVVNVGPFPGNRPPTLSLSASTQTPTLSQMVTFTATANDPDGDALAWAWDFDDGTWGANASSVSRVFATARTYNVRLVVSDMKGGTTSASVLITAGTPPNFTLSGRVLAGASPVEGVRVSDGTRATFTSADGRYAITNVPAGSFTLTATKVDFTCTRSFGAPLAVAADQAGLDFSATAIAGYSLRGKVTYGTTNLAGVVVSDGSRTATTNASGDFVLSGVPTGRYTLTATKPGWDFRVSGFTNPVEVFGGDVSALNFLATGMSLYGTIPMAGVATAPVVTDGVRTVTATVAGANWSYFLTSVPNGTWNLVATSPGVSLAPSSFVNPVLVQSASRGNLNFAPGTGYLVQGTTRTGGTPLPGVVVSDGTRTGTTDSLGSYVLAAVPAGTFTLTPTLAGYTFVPATLDVTVSTANLTGRDFATTVVNLPPTVATTAAASPNPVVGGTSTQLTVLGADDSGEAGLTYTWATTGSYPVSFSNNGTNAAKTSTATFTGVGTYLIECVIADPGGLVVRSSVTVPVQQTSTTLELTPTNVTVMTGALQNFQAITKDQFGRNMFAGTPTWSVSGGGTIVALGSQGQFTADPTPGGPFVVTGVVGGRTATTLLTVAGAGSPVISAAASAMPNPVAGLTTQLAVRATDDGGEAALLYRWSSTSGPAPVTFSSNDDNASKDVTATFTQAGDYELAVVVTDVAGNTATSTVAVTVQATPTTLDVQPRVIDVQTGQTQSFSATVTDQFADPLVPQPTITWTVPAGGTVDGAGVFTAGATTGGPFALTATSGALTANAQITVGLAPDTQPPTVTLTQPVSGSRLAGLTSLSADATDDVGVVRVDFFADGTVPLGTATSAPWGASFDAATLSDGSHVLTARAVDAAGNAATSDGVDVTVGAAPDVTAPTVSILSPAADEVTALVVRVVVQAEDDVGVTRVQLELDGTLARTLNTAPWTSDLTVSAGPHTLVAIAADAAGNTTRSGPVTFTASEDVAPPPPMTPERVLGGCGCNVVDPLAFAWLAVALLARARRSGRRGHTTVTQM